MNNSYKLYAKILLLAKVYKHGKTIVKNLIQAIAVKYFKKIDLSSNSSPDTMLANIYHFAIPFLS